MSVGPTQQDIELLDGGKLLQVCAVATAEQVVFDDRIGEELSSILALEQDLPPPAVNAISHVGHVEFLGCDVLEQFEQTLLHGLELIGLNSRESKPDSQTRAEVGTVVDGTAQLLALNKSVLHD